MKNQELSELLIDFKTNGIRKDGKLNQVIKFQDIIGRASNLELINIWDDMNNEEKKIFIWSASCCLSFESMIMVIENTMAITYRRKIMTDLDSEYNSIFQREQELLTNTKNFEKTKQQCNKIMETLYTVKEAIHLIDA